MKTEFVVSWEKFTRYSVRRYSAFFDNIEDAKKKFKKLKDDWYVRWCTIREQEVERKPEKTTINVIWWKDNI